MAQDLAGVVELPGFAGTLGRVLLVEADEQVDRTRDFGGSDPGRMQGHGGTAEVPEELREAR